MLKTTTCLFGTRAGMALIILIVLLSGLSSVQAEVYFKAGPEGFCFGNGFLERNFQRDGDLFCSTWLVNKLSGHTWRVDSREFRIRFTYERLGYWPGLENPVTIGAQDCLFRGYRIEKHADRMQSLVLSYHWEQDILGREHSSDGNSPGLEIEVEYSLEDSVPVMDKHVRVKCEGGDYYFVEELFLEDMGLAGADILHQGFGQPVYTQEMFFGLEYPAGNNMVRDGRLVLFYYPGRAVGKQGWTSYSSVWGVAARGYTRRAFLAYIDSIRAAPARPFLLYNTWYDLRTAERAGGKEAGLLNLANCLDRLQSLKENLVDHGIELNSFVLDEGWDRYTPYWEIDSKNFPGGFSRLNRALKSAGSGLGLWFGPIGGYGKGLELRGSRGRQGGLEVTNKGYLDHAGPRYNEVLRNRLLEYIDRYDVNYYKFDGLVYGYSGTDHGMLPGIYSREAQTASFISLLDTLRAAKPGIFTNITTSQWLSPWWLMHADCVFMGGGDYGWLRSLPSPSKRDLAISYRDKVFYEQFVRHNQQFPANSIMTVGVIKGEYEMLGELGETLDKWINNLVMHFSRGLSMWELYISPHILKNEEWESLRRTISWATANSDVLLANTTMVGGDPSEREPYGYFHHGEKKKILTLRNPYAEPVVFSMQLDYDGGWLEPDNEDWLPVTVYPYKAVEGPWLSYGEPLEIRLDGYETKVIELLRRDLVKLPILRGAKFDFSQGKLLVYPHRGMGAARVENCTSAAIDIAGVSIPAGTEKEVSLEIAVAQGKLEVQDRREETIAGSPGSGLAGELTLTLPEQVSGAELVFLVESDRPLSELEPVIASDAGSMNFRTETGEDNNWYCFTVALAGQSPARIVYDFGSDGSTGAQATLSSWLITHSTLQGFPLPVPETDTEELARFFLLGTDSGDQRDMKCLFKRPVVF